MFTIIQDLKYAFRTLRRSPLVTAVALATLALGIGATTAIFSILHGVLLRPLSAPEPGRIVRVAERSETRSTLSPSYEDFRDWQRQAKSYEALAAIRSQSVNVTGGGRQPERIRGLFVTASFFDVLDEGPEIGRAIAPGEDVPGGERTAVLSHGFWQRRYGGETGVIGEPIVLNNEVHTIVGVMSADFRLPLDTTEAWISLHTYPGALDRSHRTFTALGRLADGSTVEEAAREMDTILARLGEAYPDPNRGTAGDVVTLTDLFLGSRVSEQLLLVFTAVSLVLLIGCANVANLQLARAAGRDREMAVRTALGGGRLRLLRQLMTENAVLAFAGGLLGLAVGHGALGLLLRFGPSRMDALYDIEINAAVLVFAATVSLGTGVVFGLAPAAKASKTDLVEALRESGHSLSAGGRTGALRGALVVAQIALAVLLLVASGLLMRSFANLRNVDVGFDTDNLLTMQFRIPGNKYETDEQVVTFFDQMLQRVAAVPGVQGVACAQSLPFTGDDISVPFLADGVDPGPDVEVPSALANRVNAGYFEVLGIPLLSGRTLTSQDRAGGNPVAVVNQRLASEFWPGEDVVGRTFRVRGRDETFTVVGVVGDVYSRSLQRDPEPAIFVPQSQMPFRFATIGVRVPSDPLSYAASVREAIWELDPDQPLWEVMTQNQRIESRIGGERFTTSLLAVFSAVAVLLASIGIAGVTAYSVGQRTREIGIRLALGAARSRILRMVMRQGLSMVLIGLAIGLAGAVAVSRALSSALYGVGTLDLVAFGVAPVVLAVVALAACYVPARRASRVDPGITLRCE